MTPPPNLVAHSARAHDLPPSPHRSQVTPELRRALEPAARRAGARAPPAGAPLLDALQR